MKGPRRADKKSSLGKGQIKAFIKHTSDASRSSSDKFDRTQCTDFSGLGQRIFKDLGRKGDMFSAETVSKSK
jgi:methionyl-tRNA synthetase